jgi:4-diphosphocytidyl-2-C-methyl-D-erythritol kinase
MIRGTAAAKINLALVVGPRRGEGKHELVTLYQRIALADRIALRRADRTVVEGFTDDTLVIRALELLATHGGTTLAARVEKRIPVAAGLGGGSADAAAALQLGNALLATPLPADRLHELAASLGADVPFFLRDGPQLGTGDGTQLEAVDLPQDYWILLVLPAGEAKRSTAAVYASFDDRGGEAGFDERRAALLAAIGRIHRPRDLALLPLNDLAFSPLANELTDLGALRADVSGAGPVVYGLFLHRETAVAARRRLRARGRTWITAPAWYV